MKRRAFLTGLIATPAVIMTPGLLMPVKPVIYDYQRLMMKIALNSPHGHMNCRCVVNKSDYTKLYDEHARIRKS